MVFKNQIMPRRGADENTRRLNDARLTCFDFGRYLRTQDERRQIREFAKEALDRIGSFPDRAA